MPRPAWPRAVETITAESFLSGNGIFSGLQPSPNPLILAAPRRSPPPPFGPRPPGSAANQKLQAYIESQLKPLHCQISFDAFTAQTPVGPVPMRNIIAKFPGSSGRAIVITCGMFVYSQEARLTLST
jgi:hypothetical protein